ncbi:helix-turn-helix domain-containing protein [Nocardia sp. NPDC050406]|uniref:helix-turn-helix domain-containing protein n=1 Tax=Nocardia sp. NPDC050406 TaxID=3364318 RepID=UPI0037BDA8E0
MPGGRLTHDDRRRIAAGIAQGLGYAAIARQLDRPTSTISREVSRNGGPNRYRADLAHAATEMRSRRRASRRRAEPPSGTDEYGRAPETIADFVTGFGELFEQTGVPRTAAAVLARLYAADSGSATAAELVRDLRISPATVSAAVGYLQAQAVIRRERDPRSRRDRYIIDEYAWYRATLAGAQANRIVAERAREGAAALGASTPAAIRLLAMSDYMDRVSVDMVRSAEKWRTTLAQ